VVDQLEIYNRNLNLTTISIVSLDEVLDHDF
jgi:hypothetical protein